MNAHRNSLILLLLAITLAIPPGARSQEDEEKKEDGSEREMLRASLVYQSRSGTPLQHVSYLLDGGSARFPVECVPGQRWIAKVATTSIKGKGRFLTVEIEDVSMFASETEGGAAMIVPVRILEVSIPYEWGRTMSVLETPLYSLSVSVAPVVSRGRR